MEHTKSQYDENFYRVHLSRKSYYYLARFLGLVFEPRTATDFGCGLGRTLWYLQELYGTRVLGIESSPTANNFSKIPLQPHDLSQQVNLGNKYDLVISVEVAEHIPHNAADQFIENLVQHSRDIIFFTAAQPGQGGTGHVNCQTKVYWAEKFSHHGYKPSSLLEWCMKIALRPLMYEMPWVAQNGQIFVRKLSNSYIGNALAHLPSFLLSSLYWRYRFSRIGGACFWIPGPHATFPGKTLSS